MVKSARFRPAKPQLPRQLEPASLEAHPLGDETRWDGLAFEAGSAGPEPAEGFDVEGCRLDRVDLSGSVWRRGSWRDFAVTDANLANIDAYQCLWQRGEISTVRGTGMQWTDGTVKDVVFSGCRLDLAGFRFTRLSHVVFDDCRLTGGDFTEADLSGARFVRCDLSGALFHHAVAVGAQFDDCTLDDLSGVEALRGASVSAHDLTSLTFSMAAALGIEIIPGHGD